MNAKTRAVLRMLGAVSDTPDSTTPPEAKPTPSFDGGARQSPPLAPESHGEWLGRVLRGEGGAPRSASVTCRCGTVSRSF